ncbi:hypothetical protein AB0393_29910 [Streptomyces cyaneofuscatus]|uniref:hypothetical protein n=1 Tax=Streptomyces TaxID=1883 RepID=UPI00344E3162
MTTPGADGHRPGQIDARNDLSGTIHGPVVQAATIHGGITYTVQQAPPTGLRVTPDEIPPLMVRFINRTESLSRPWRAGWHPGGTTPVSASPCCTGRQAWARPRW